MASKKKTTKAKKSVKKKGKKETGSGIEVGFGSLLIEAGCGISFDGKALTMKGNTVLTQKPLIVVAENMAIGEGVTALAKRGLSVTIEKI